MPHNHRLRCWFFSCQESFLSHLGKAKRKLKAERTWMIERRPIRQWFVDAPAGLGVLAIALVSSFVGINNMAISGEVSCDRQANHTTTCTITTSHLTGSKAQTIERVKSAQVVSSKTSSREISGDQYRHRVWLSPRKGSILQHPDSPSHR